MMSKLLIGLCLIITLVLWASLKVASDADDQAEKRHEEDGK